MVSHHGEHLEGDAEKDHGKIGFRVGQNCLGGAEEPEDLFEKEQDEN